ncbi:MAG TPA: deoxyhypusine synthase [Phycisphaerae bacterium]|nr:deoxyhypusine synthase [Phycisphaerae bacterium]HRR85871.1 deoxyhypusine synthase [Phycisphaerae bacterium]
MARIQLPKKFTSKYPHKFAKGKQRFLCGKRILPKPITGKESLPDLMDQVFLAYNAARLQEACRLFTERMLQADVTVGMSLAGALTPAGLGCSAIVPLIKAGYVDWIVSTGANLYHDMHHAMNLPLFRGSPFVRDPELRKVGVVRIYDILLDYNDVLMQTDHILRQILLQPEFQHEMGTAELHYLLGKYCAEFEEQTGHKDVSVLAAAYRAGVPCFCPSPGDSTIGMNVAGLELRGSKLRVNPSRDVNETTAIVLDAKLKKRRTGVVLVGGGSPKNFTLQTEPQIQEVLRIPEAGHDLFIQFTDARPDTGGLSGATPHEAVSWGKVDPNKLPDAIVCYLDSTVALPLLTHYALARHKPRRFKRLYDRLPELRDLVSKEYWKRNKQL